MHTDPVQRLLAARAALIPTDRRTPEGKTAAAAADKATHMELKALNRLPGNGECADCTAKYPGWAVLPWGVFVCIDCAQVHRHLGRHISQVTSPCGVARYVTGWLALLHAGRPARPVG